MTRTVTLTEREVDAVRSAMNLYEATFGTDEELAENPKYGQDIRALARVNTKFAKVLR